MSEPKIAAARTLAASLFLAGCGDSLPSVEKVIEYRILSAPVAVTVPHDPQAGPQGYVRAQAMPGETVQVTPFAVSPEGVVDPEDLEPLWIACELFLGGGPFACLSEQVPLELDSLPRCVFPTLADLSMSAAPPELQTPCLLSREANPTFTVPVSAGVLSGADIELTVIGRTPAGSSTERCAADLLAGAADVPNDCLYGVQVVSVGPKARLIDWLASLGVDLGEIDVPDPDTIEDPDLHPQVTSFTVSVLDESGREVAAPIEVPFGGEFAARPGQVLRIETTSPESDLQDFQIPVNGGASFEPGKEEYRGRWFITWGDLLSPMSFDAQSYNEWTLRASEQDSPMPPGGVAHLYYVVHDGRNGAANWWISLRFD